MVNEITTNEPLFIGEVPDVAEPAPRRRVPDLPSSCSLCIYRFADTDVLRCRRHAPGAQREEKQPTYWPVVPPDHRCGEGSLGNNPKAQHVLCDTCRYWFWEQGGIKPRFPGRLSNEWWQGAGYCKLRAPYPSGNDNKRPIFSGVTHFRQGCGDGSTVEDDLITPQNGSDLQSR